MSQLHLPWVELVLVSVCGGAAWAARASVPEEARRRAILAGGIGLAIAVGAWLDLAWLGVPAAVDGTGLLERAVGRSLFEIDTLSAPLVPLTALVYFVTMLTTLPTKVRRFSFARTLVSEALALATFSCRDPWTLVALLLVAAIPPALELRSRRRSVRVYAVHQVAFALALSGGWLLADTAAASGIASHAGFGLVALALAVRCGIVPMHCWVTDLVENATFGTTLLTLAPLGGAYAAVRLITPSAPQVVQEGLAIAAVLTALYAAGMSLTQTSARRFFCFALLSHSALVLGGLAMGTTLSLTAALYLWFSVALSFTGLGLVLRSLEARTGRLSLKEFHGLHTQTPILAGLFLIAALGAVGFPGTIGFFGIDLLVEGTSQSSPVLSTAIVVATAVNGIAGVRAYGVLFTGARHAGSVNLRCRRSERIAILTLLVLVLGGSVSPQPAVRSRARAAQALLDERAARTQEASGRSLRRVAPPRKPVTTERAGRRTPGSCRSGGAEDRGLPTVTRASIRPRLTTWR